MTNQTEIAQSLDVLVDGLQAALDKIDAALAEMDGRQLFDTLCLVRKYGNLREAHHRILFEKLEAANAEDSARSNHPLSIYLSRPDAPYRLGWQLAALDGQVTVMCRDFATFEEGKAAGDALLEFLNLAGRMSDFEYETPRPDGVKRPADLSSDIPF